MNTSMDVYMEFHDIFTWRAPKTSFDVYMEFNDIFPWRAPLTFHLTLYWKKSN